ncbi:type VII secretion integral membrane protein EccD [Streptomyces pinistramenti]|uniref:type VII secretion integral membrane protein EccD n=1 Tax=Streptomyces pinistramenti TaxID=2884812 RepID=UPI001D087AF6|nr:type VII secretion integral membrane protein EccD [Streptomyces pinistramenti]MCB5907925.1 type VII secretion integral membrane protein EccD [Streptomyces pinistramenti]
MVSVHTDAAAAGAGQRASLSRVTLVGERRRVDLVLPAQEPIGVLLPDILRLLDDRPGTAPVLRRLVTAGGSVLAQDDSLASAQVPDGAVLRLVREHETPAAPVVHDATDDVAEDLDIRAWRWGDRSRTWTAGTASVLLALTAGVCAAGWYGPARAALWLGVIGGLAAAAGAVCGLLKRRALGTALLVPAGAVGALASWQAASTGPARLAAVGLTVAATLALLGLCTGLGRGGLIGAATVGLAVGAWEAGLAVTDVPRTGVALGVVAVLALGYLPRLALMAAGLTRLDDQRSGGTPVSRHQVATALGATHRGLALATVAMAVSAGAAGILAAGADDGWATAAALLVCVVLFSRARAYPLALEVIALLAAGTAVGVGLLLRWAASSGDPTGALVLLSLLAVLPLAVLAVRVPEHIRVRLRRVMNLVESVGVVALFPVALGAFGVYGRLLHTF